MFILNSFPGKPSDLSHLEDFYSVRKVQHWFVSQMNEHTHYSRTSSSQLACPGLTLPFWEFIQSISFWGTSSSGVVWGALLLWALA